VQCGAARWGATLAIWASGPEAQAGRRAQRARTFKEWLVGEQDGSVLFGADPQSRDFSATPTAARMAQLRRDNPAGRRQKPSTRINARMCINDRGGDQRALSSLPAHSRVFRLSVVRGQRSVEVSDQAPSGAKSAHTRMGPKCRHADTEFVRNIESHPDCGGRSQRDIRPRPIDPGAGVFPRARPSILAQAAGR
jgi:hypothetical protein